jgi:hypothetical protein
MTINIMLPSLSPKTLGLLACLVAIAISAVASAAEPVKTCTKGKTTIVAQADGTTKIVTRTVCEVK